MAEEVNNKVLAIVANIINNKETTKDATKDEDEVQTEKTTKKEPIRGMPKSGRFWKSKKERFSTINKTKGLKPGFEKLQARKMELKRIKELSKQRLEEIKQRDLERKERRRQNLKRAEENKHKAEVVQVITNTAKLKRMRKKQLRFIEKRDTNKQVEATK